MRFLLFLVTFLISISASAQCDTSRYLSPIFDSVVKHANVQYGSAQVWNIPYNNTDLFMDVYEPANDTLTKRPLMIWAHPGGFLLGDKEADDMVALCDSFARKGYVTVSIGYRLGFNPLSQSSAVRAVYRGTQDMRAAIRYLKEFAPTYGIDTNFTFVGGSSAGAFATLHTAYLTDAEAPTDIQGGIGYPALGCLDCSGNSYQHNMDLTGFVSLWGALGDSNYIQASETVPALLIHGEADGTVPIGTGNPFGVFTTPIVNGSRPISNQLTSLGIQHTFMPFDSLDHEFHGADNGTFNNPPNQYWDTIVDAIQNHYYPLLLPTTPSVNGDFNVCIGDTLTYLFQGQAQETFCYEINNGTVLMDLGDAIQVVWNTTGPASISLIAYNSIQAPSSKFVLNIFVNALPDASFTYVANNTNVDFTSTVGGQSSYFWDFDSQVTSTDESPSFDFLGSGTYAIVLTVTDSNSCSNSSSQAITLIGVGLDEFTNYDFLVYPNPSAEKIFIELQNLAEIEIVDQSGRVVKEISTSSIKTEVDISSFANGIYLLRITAEGQVFEKQLFVHH